ncbi:MAG TPA: glucosaminidase domain-containing protein [Chloroflexia bacterium]|nr:glucosaminidase domain-containing protein [Chloroflexia bacterium]
MGLSLAAPALAASPTPATDRPAVAPPTADHRLDRPPSISAARIDAVLAEYGSPAAGLGTTFYDLGLRYGIDPAYPLAFFIVESQAGTQGVARTTHSIGNIRCTPGYRCLDGYQAYSSWAAGVEDWYELIRELYMDQWRLLTPDMILPRYAPWGDNNDPVKYTASVNQLVDEWCNR